MKTEVHRIICIHTHIHVQSFSSYRAVNTFRVGYKNQSLNGITYRYHVPNFTKI